MNTKLSPGDAFESAKGNEPLLIIPARDRWGPLLARLHAMLLSHSAGPTQGPNDAITSIGTANAMDDWYQTYTCEKCLNLMTVAQSGYKHCKFCGHEVPAPEGPEKTGTG